MIWCVKCLAFPFFHFLKTFLTWYIPLTFHLVLFYDFHVVLSSHCGLSKKTLKMGDSFIFSLFWSPLFDQPSIMIVTAFDITDKAHYQFSILYYVCTVYLACLGLSLAVVIVKCVNEVYSLYYTVLYTHVGTIAWVLWDLKGLYQLSDGESLQHIRPEPEILGWSSRETQPQSRYNSRLR